MDDPREATRLKEKANAEPWARRFLLPHLSAGKTFLELGCGPGEFIHAVLTENPGIRAVGVDISPERIDVARQRNAQWPGAQFFSRAAHDTGLDTGCCDLVFSRFMMEYVPNKQEVLDEMFRVSRPGGKVILQDLDGQLLWHFPEPAHLTASLGKVVAALGTTGFDPFVGRKLAWFAKKAGFEDLDVAIEPYHLIVGAVDPASRGHWQAKLEIARPLIDHALGGDDAASEYIDNWLAYADDPETLTYSVLFTVTAVKPSAFV
jgi:ubiquinone/menaquinone biosynthesis C-methylase UbiE